jgi:hypothetical protein
MDLLNSLVLAQDNSRGSEEASEQLSPLGRLLI